MFASKEIIRIIFVKMGIEVFTFPRFPFYLVLLLYLHCLLVVHFWRNGIPLILMIESMISGHRLKLSTDADVHFFLFYCRRLKLMYLLRISEVNCNEIRRIQSTVYCNWWFFKYPIRKIIQNMYVNNIEIFAMHQTSNNEPIHWNLNRLN